MGTDADGLDPDAGNRLQSSVVIVGGGRMGAALASGLLRVGKDPSSISIVEHEPKRLVELASELPGVELARSLGELAVVRQGTSPKAAVLAVKPADAQRAAAEVSAAAFDLVLSIMAGVTIDSLQSFVGPEIPVVRSMPNTPALIGAGVSAIAGGSTATDVDLDWAEQILGAVGTVVRLPEKSLDAVTGLSGSGPAYIFLVAEALIDAGVLAGLPRTVSATLAIETLAGAARLLVESGEEPERLRAQVTSPGGTTAAGLRVLESRSVRSAFLEAVMAATERSRQLGS
jgi:pyrroline-5-carboxylate reductase